MKSTIRVAYFKKSKPDNVYHCDSVEEAVTFIREGLEEGYGLPKTIENVDEDGEVVHIYEVDVAVTLTPRAS